MTGRSRRSGAPASRRQGKSVGGERWKAEQRHKRCDDARRDAIHAVADARRDDVYRSDVVFTGDEIPKRLPRKGTPERAELVSRVAAMKAEGMANLAIEAELGISNVWLLLREAKAEPTAVVEWADGGGA